MIVWDSTAFLVCQSFEFTVKTENGYQAALRPRLPPRAAPRLVHQDLWPIRTNVGGFFFGFEVGIPDL
jgi:hypothetical protein